MQSRPDGQAFVACGGLNPGAAKGSVGEQLAVGHAVQRAAACHGEILHGDALV